MKIEEYLIGKKFGTSDMELIDVTDNKWYIKTLISSTHAYSKKDFLRAIKTCNGFEELKDLYPEEFI